MSKIERHNTGSFEIWSENFALKAARIVSLTKSLPEMPDACGTLVQLGAERAAIASLRPESEGEICEGMRLAAQAAAATFVSAARSEGDVRAIIGSDTVSFPVTGPTSTAHVGAWLLGFSAAVICRDRMGVGILRSDATLQAALASSTTGDAFWSPLAQALAALTRNDNAACLERSSEARQIIATGAGSMVNPQFVRATKLPLLELCEALAGGGSVEWDRLVAGALESHRNFWGEVDNEQDAVGFLAFDVSALCAVAHDRGIITTVESPYLLRAAVQGACAGAGADVTYVFPRSEIEDAADAHRIIDSHGCQGAEVKHEMVEQDGALVAIYHCTPDGDGPRMLFEFDLTESAESSDGATGLDAGEHMERADAAAKAVPASLQGLSPDERAAARAKLEKALAHWREILAYIPPGESRVPDSAFWTDEGQQVRQAEPGRFNRDRLEAVLNSWTRLLDLYGEKQPPASAQSADARAQALGALELIRAQVHPVLTAIVHDATGEIAAQLAPREEDYARVFVGEAIEAARAVYGKMFSDGLDIPRPPSSSVEIRSYVAPAGMFADENELSHHFPSGYRGIAGWLNPHKVWVAWKCIPTGQSSGHSFDGLVWCDDHWTWFPKPYRALAPLGVRPRAQT